MNHIKYVGIEREKIMFRLIVKEQNFVKTTAIKRLTMNTENRERPHLLLHKQQ